MPHPQPESSLAWLLSLIAARTLIILVVLVAGLRILGKRQIGQVNIYDLALIMALANAVQNAMTSGNGHVLVGIVSAGTLLVAGRLISMLFVRLPSLERRLVGAPTVLIQDGAFVTAHLQREHVTQEQVLMALRQHGIDDIHRIAMAVLEIDGTISIVPTEAKQRRHLAR